MSIKEEERTERGGGAGVLGELREDGGSERSTHVNTGEREITTERWRERGFTLFSCLNKNVLSLFTIIHFI